MKTLKFKTNINCGGCLSKVGPLLNGEKTIEKWDVDITTPGKILSVETNEETPDKIIDVVKKAGYKIEQISN